MRKRKDVSQVLANAHAAFRAMARNAPGPAQKRWATQMAAQCLWALEIPEFDGLKAEAPEGEVIDLHDRNQAVAVVDG